ncbi:MAG TPA: TIGR02587 family membrane protein [Leptolyngbyaceae cyanobacterium M33_DOE_097]|nr:TIGR02587 family membrane protein [Leptolyngbyaceae cyanobacterium M33_DOE_097]
MAANRLKNLSAWRDELDDLIRGASGGFLFGIPLLYTMEVWWIGSSVQPPRILMAMLLTFAIIFLLNRTEGFRKVSDTNALNAAMDSIEAIAIGITCTGLILFLLREIDGRTPLAEMLGKLVYESIPFALGVALANQFLGDDRQSGRQPKKQNHHHRSSNSKQFNATLADIGGTLIGATVIGFNIAPTDEVSMLATAVSGPWLLAVMIVSLIISYAIVFQAEFSNQDKREQQQGIFQRPLSETFASYIISLLAAAMMLLLFDRLSWSDPWQQWLSYIILLGLPATIGGAAGRLAV